MVVSRAQLVIWFTTAKKPTQGQFSDRADSFWHKNEDTIPIGKIDNLNTTLATKADATVVNSLLPILLAAGTATFVVAAGTLIEKLLVIDESADIVFNAGTTALITDVIEGFEVNNHAEVYVLNKYFRVDTTLYFPALHPIQS